MKKLITSINTALFFTYISTIGFLYANNKKDPLLELKEQTNIENIVNQFTLAQNRNQPPPKEIIYPISKGMDFSNVNIYSLKEPLSKLEFSVKDINKKEKKEDVLFDTLSYLLPILHATDYFTTIEALKDNTFKEGNPLMKKISENQLLFGGIKLGVSYLQLTLLKEIYKKNKTMALITASLIDIVLGVVIYNNIDKINKAKNKN